MQKCNFAIQHLDKRITDIFQPYLERITPFTQENYKISILGDCKFFPTSPEYDKSSALTSVTI